MPQHTGEAWRSIAKYVLVISTASALSTCSNRNRSNVIRDRDDGEIFRRWLRTNGHWVRLLGAPLKNRAVPGTAQAASQCFDVWHEQLPCNHLPNGRFRGHV